MMRSKLFQRKLRGIKRFLRELQERRQLMKLREQLNGSHGEIPADVPRLDRGAQLRILFNTQYPWFYTWIEYILANQLRNQGHQVTMLACDGLPYCEQETLTTPRPSCQSCFKRMKRQLNAFNLPFHTLSKYISIEDREESRSFAAELSIAQMREFTAEGVALGEIAYRNLIHYYKGVVPIEGKVEEKFRQIFESALLILHATTNFFKTNSVDTVVSANGKFIQSGIGVEHAAHLQIPYVTWEVFNQFTGAIFAKNSIALDQRLDDLWENEKEKSLTVEQKAKLYKNFADQAASKNTPFKYVEDHYDISQQSLINRYHLNKNNPMIVMFPNVEWDSTAMIASGFASMLDWLCAAIEYGIKYPDYQIIIRAHPGELKVPPDLQTTTPICDRLRERYPSLPANIHLIGPTEAVSSYALADMASAILVYSSTMGLEFALRGKRAWVAAKTYYAEKGFTVDIQSKAHLYELLNQKQFNLRLTEQEHTYAERLAYIVRYRRLFSFPFFKKGSFDFEKYAASLNDNGSRGQAAGCRLNANAVINNICELIEGKRNYLDLGEANW